MKKRLIITVVALAVMMSFSGCGKKNTNSASTTENTTGDVKQALDSYGKNASDNADMNKVEGKALEEEKNDNVQSKDNIGNYEVSIDDAKVIDYENNKVIVVSFEFKNNTANEINFSGATDVEVTQNNASIPPIVVNNVEGFDAATLAQNVAKGKTITVQRAYKILDAEAPVTVTVRAFDKENNKGSVEKTFNLK